MSSNFKGYTLASRLIAKHFGLLGDKIAEAIAGFDPETATEVDRENLQKMVRQTAIKLAEARQSYQKEQGEVDALQALVEKDSANLTKLSERLSKGEVSEAAVNLYLDELEANKGRLPQEVQEAQDAKEYLDAVEDILKQLSAQLEQFDAHAKKVRDQLRMANAQRDLAQLRIDRQSELGSLKGLSASTTALSALAKKASKVAAEAEGLKIVADIGQKPLDNQKAVEDLRTSLNDEDKQVSAADRLARLTASAA